jgi:hypothetical protein
LLLLWGAALCPGLTSFATSSGRKHMSLEKQQQQQQQLA